jgi:hypothetical protein
VGRSALWGIADAAAPQDGTEEVQGPALDDLAGRAVAIMHGAQNLAAFLSSRLDAPDRWRALLSSVGFCFLAAAVGLAAQRPFNVLSSSPAWLLAIAEVASVAAGAASFGLASWLAERHRNRSLALMADVAQARNLGLVARRIDTSLAGIYSRAVPRAEECKVVSAILGHLERDLAALNQKSTGRRSAASEGFRRHERIVPRRTRTTVRLENGRVLSARIKDVSLSGVAIETELPAVELQATVMVGSRPARAVRKLHPGIAFEFLEPLNPTTFDPDVVI